MEALLTGFPDQCRRAVEIPAATVPKRRFSCVCIAGMGGSAMGGDILTVLADPRKHVPLLVHRNYGLPPAVDEHSLVLAISYSGDTEETLSAFEEARRRGASRWVLTSGGKLLDRAVRYGDPHAVIPSGFPPRCALGYLLIPCIRLLNRLGLVPCRVSPEILDAVSASVVRYSRDDSANPALSIARKFHGRVPVLYSGALLSPVLVRWKTQLAENSKTFGCIGTLPEMNHNEIMSWRFPRGFVRMALPVFFRSAKDPGRIRRRMDITRKIVSGVQPDVLELQSEGPLLKQILELIVLGDWVSFYLALLYGADPTEIPAIRTLKEALSSGKETS